MSRPTAKDLAVAARDGQLDEMTRLLAIGVAINDVVEFGGTALTQAAAADQRAAVQFLLEKGADINAITAGNVSVVGIAAEKGFEGVTRLLCERGADLKIADRVRSAEAFFWAGIPRQAWLPPRSVAQPLPWIRATGATAGFHQLRVT